jgi:streptomycin 6-kinase
MYDLIPAHFAHEIIDREADGYLSGEDWLQGLPRLLEDLLAEWEIEPIGRSMNGYCSVVVPVRLVGPQAELAGPSGEAVLKVSWPHPEAATEHLALQVWNGHGAVRLLRADPSRA